MKTFTHTATRSVTYGNTEVEVAIDYYYLGDSIVANSGEYYTGRYRYPGSKEWHKKK